MDCVQNSCAELFFCLYINPDTRHIQDHIMHVGFSSCNAAVAYTLLHFPQTVAIVFQDGDIGMPESPHDFRMTIDRIVTESLINRKCPCRFNNHFV